MPPNHVQPLTLYGCMHVCVEEVEADPAEDTEDDEDTPLPLPPLKITRKPKPGAVKGMTLHF
jgi:hypothetical protein